MLPVQSCGATKGLVVLPPVRLLCHHGPIALGAIDVGLAVELLFFANRGEAGLFAGRPLGGSRLCLRCQRAEEEQNEEQKGAKVAHTVQ